MQTNRMRVKKRNGTLVPVRLDEITDRIAFLSNDLDQTIVDPVKITLEVVEKIHDGISTSLLDSFTAEICHTKAIEHPHFNILASRLIISDHQKTALLTTKMKFSECCKILYSNTDQLNEPSPLISDELFKISQEMADDLDSYIQNDRDFLFDYFGFKTLLKSYLLKVGTKVIETPQHMWMRVALGIHGPIKLVDGTVTSFDMNLVKETYDLLSQKYFTHATPTLYNAGTRRNQLFSCFLEGIDDNLTSIYKVLSDTAQISKWAGGIGIHVSDIRAAGSYIRGTGGKGDGLVPMIKVFNSTARYVNQGGRRAGSFAMYLEPWHADVQDFLKCKLPHGDENRRARDLFYAMWIPDLFMERVLKNESWSLMCPSECNGLSDVHGKEFNKLYEKYEKEGRIVRTVNARVLFEQMVSSQIETGTPYMLYKDSANAKSNQKNIGTIKSSNLCAEIIEYSNTNKYACCVLASIVLPTYVITPEKTKKDTDPKMIFDHAKLHEIVKVVTRNLNKVIDVNYYPVPETKTSNMSERPIGIGIQGLADVFFKLGLPYDSEEAIQLDREIMETIYHGALTASLELSKKDGPYATFKGSPISKGHFQFDLWKEHNGIEITHSGRWNWDSLRKDIKKHGVRNSLVTALMPTASTSHIMGSASEAFEPITSNCYSRRIKAGEYMVMNPYMANDLIKLGIWNEKMRENLLEGRGSIQNIPEIPQKMKDIYKTVWELKQKCLIDHSVARGIYVDQSQSLNLYFAIPNAEQICKAHFYGWSKGLKTGSYYIRTKPREDSASFTLDKNTNTEENNTESNVVCTDEVCVVCSS